MRAISANVTPGLPVGAVIDVVDNSGAKQIELIGVKGYRGVKKRISRAGIADIVLGVVKKGKPDVRHTVVMAVIVRQKQEYRRANGLRVKFEDNAAIVLKDLKEKEPKGTTVKGPVAKEVIERFPPISKICSIVV